MAGKQDWFCMNYYVDEMGVDIPEKNIFYNHGNCTYCLLQGITHFSQFHCSQ